VRELKGVLGCSRGWFREVGATIRGLRGSVDEAGKELLAYVHKNFSRDKH
jgi:hypothetical protein